ncbi:hypothetical protein [Frankia sp. Cppng1_Ct_nod]|uniref:hypothetical protein n=1 Tax=Frankia sp. Cppng1_Ct_nod TaxID=2897162 RepID=UPI001F5F48F0|nr:hypothetical protein [Frankia sp. Cppng1_Ct_nod]
MATSMPDLSTRQPEPAWTPDRVRALGVTTDLRTAGSVLSIKETKAYALAAAGAFPVPAIRAGGRWVVPVAPILRLLGLETTVAAELAPVPAGGAV